MTTAPSFVGPAARVAGTVVLPAGFTEGPGGEEYNDRQAFSYHVYCANSTQGVLGERVMADV